MGVLTIEEVEKAYPCLDCQRKARKTGRQTECEVREYQNIQDDTAYDNIESLLKQSHQNRAHLETQLEAIKERRRKVYKCEKLEKSCFMDIKPMSGQGYEKAVSYLAKDDPQFLEWLATKVYVSDKEDGSTSLYDYALSIEHLPNREDTQVVMGFVVKAVDNVKVKASNKKVSNALKLLRIVLFSRYLNCMKPGELAYYLGLDHAYVNRQLANVHGAFKREVKKAFIKHSLPQKVTNRILVRKIMRYGRLISKIEDSSLSDIESKYFQEEIDILKEVCGRLQRSGKLRSMSKLVQAINTLNKVMILDEVRKLEIDIWLKSLDVSKKSKNNSYKNFKNKWLGALALFTEEGKNGFN